MSNRQLACAALVLLVFVVFGCALSWTKAPWCDEGWFGSAAYHFAAHGRLVVPSLIPSPDDTKWERSDQHIFWCMPLYLVWEGAMAKLLGFGLFQLRLYSLLWGAAAIVAWGLVVREMTRDRAAMWWTLLLLAFDHILLVKATDVRMDLMSAALGALAVWAYLRWRVRSLSIALLLAQSLSTLSMLTHPNGGILAFLDIAILAAYYDWRRLRPAHALAALAPCLAGGLAWGLYLMQDLPLAWLQFSGNASGRFSGLVSPLAALRREIADRYLTAFGWGPAAPVAGRLKILLLIAYLGGVCACWRLRRKIPGAALLLTLLAAHVLVLAFFEATKQGAYLAHLVPLLTIPLALSLRNLWDRIPERRWALAGAVFLLVALQLAASAAVIVRSRKGEFDRATAFLARHTTPADVLIGPTEIGFTLGFDRPLVDDQRLGYYRRCAPKFIVIGDAYLPFYERAQSEQPDVYRHVRSALARSTVVLREKSLTIYQPPAAD